MAYAQSGLAGLGLDTSGINQYIQALSNTDLENLFKINFDDQDI
jgi:hypothetical protein